MVADGRHGKVSDPWRIAVTPVPKAVSWHTRPRKHDTPPKWCILTCRPPLPPPLSQLLVAPRSSTVVSRPEYSPHAGINSGSASNLGTPSGRRTRPHMSGCSATQGRPRCPSSDCCRHCVTCCNVPSFGRPLPRSPRNPSDRNADPEWWPAGIDSPTRYFFLRARQLRYLRQHPPRDAKLQWRPFAEVTYRECRMLRRRGCPPLEVHVPMAMTGIEHSGQAAIKYLGSVVVSLQELHHPRAAAWASPVRLASPTEPSPTCTHAATAVPAYAGWNVQSPLFAAALAAAKRLAAAAAAASVGAGSHRESSGGSSSSATGGSSLWRMLHHTDIPTLSPTGSSGSLSIASSSTFTFSSSMRQLDPLKPSPTSPSNQQPAYCGQPPVMPACPNATHTPSSLLAVPACQAASLASPVLLATPPRSSQYHDQYRPEGQHQLPPQWLDWQPGRAYQPSQNKWGPAHEAATQHVAVL